MLKRDSEVYKYPASPDLMRNSILNYRLMLYSNAIAYFAFNLIGPFFVIFINKIGGGIENLGLLYGISLMANSIASYFVGRASDKFGRKPFLLISSFAGSILIILYLYVQNLAQLYVLQIASGINNAVWVVSENSFMADITHIKTRGRTLGFYNMFLGLIASLAIMVGGFAIGKMGFNIIFWFVGIMSLLSTIFLFFIREKR